MTRIALFTICCTAWYYLLARASITEWFWGRWDEQSWLGRLLACPACSGTWIGMAVGLWYPVTPRATPLMNAGAGMVCTAICWGLMKAALAYGAVAASAPPETPAGEGTPQPTTEEPPHA